MQSSLTANRRVFQFILSLVCIASLAFVLGRFPLAAHAAGTSSPSPLDIGISPCAYNPNDPRTRAYYILPLAPGSHFSNCIFVSNHSSSPAQIQLQPTEGVTSNTTGTVYPGPGTPLSGAGKWVTITSTPKQILPAESVIKVYFSVHVPQDATPGDHMAGVQALDLGAPGRISGTINVDVSATVGVLIVVPNTPSFKANFSGEVSAPHIAPIPSINTAAVVVPIGDNGQLYGQPFLKVSLKGPNGYSHTYQSQLGTILPGQKIPYSVPWPTTLAPGKYIVTITMRWDNSTQNGITPGSITHTYSINLASSLQSSAPGKIVVIRTTNLGLIGDWWFWASIVGGLLLIGLCIYLIRRVIAKRAEKKARPNLDSRLRSL